MDLDFVALCTEWNYVCCFPSIPATLQVSDHSFEKPDIFHVIFPQNGLEIYFIRLQDRRNSENWKSRLQWLSDSTEGLGTKMADEISFT